MKVTYYGHSCLMVETGGCKLLFDPYITENPNASHIDISSLQPDYVLVSHGHDDHMADAEEILKASGATLISNFEIVTWFQGRGIEHAQALNHGGSHPFRFGRARYVTAIHSSVLPDGTYGGNPGRFVIESQSGTFYFSGDTALTYDMKIIGERYHLKWAALCIGDNYTMGPADAAMAANWIKATKVVGIHYDTFPAIQIDHNEARRLFAAQNVNLILAPIGGSVEIV